MILGTLPLKDDMINTGHLIFVIIRTLGVGH